MNLLLDTCTLLWWVNGSPVSAEATEAISDPDNVVWVSAASAWEISIKQAIGKLTVRGDFDAAVDEDFEQLPISLAHARLAGQLPRHHRDPFDRMLVAQAQLHDFLLVTRDAKIREYGAAVLVS
ncbi:MAG: type II toxin-antitoxin system VapC family toxin [Acidimicrobiaceae bacterium]|nr:type II toxin-antitoxin system VapC family toxin [Acidimicrobiaceae bacterium]